MSTYHQLTKDDSCSELLKKFFEISNLTTGQALDLGCGSGRDSLELLKRGWNVTSVDKSVEGVNFLKERVSDRDAINIRNESFEGLTLSQNYYDFVYSSFALSFCQKSDWPKLWKEIVNSLNEDGVLAINFFGVNDGFKDSKLYGDMTFFNKEDINMHLSSFNIMYEEEKEVDKESKVGQMKHWHVFTVIAQKSKLTST
jgi:tellurite methyltransferase